MVAIWSLFHIPCDVYDKLYEELLYILFSSLFYVQQTKEEKKTKRKAELTIVLCQKAHRLPILISFHSSFIHPDYSRSTSAAGRWFYKYDLEYNLTGQDYKTEDVECRLMDHKESRREWKWNRNWTWQQWRRLIGSSTRWWFAKMLLLRPLLLLLFLILQPMSYWTNKTFQIARCPFSFFLWRS